MKKIFTLLCFVVVATLAGQANTHVHFILPAGIQANANVTKGSTVVKHSDKKDGDKIDYDAAKDANVTFTIGAEDGYIVENTTVTAYKGKTITDPTNIISSSLTKDGDTYKLAISTAVSSDGEYTIVVTGTAKKTYNITFNTASGATYGGTTATATEGSTVTFTVDCNGGECTVSYKPGKDAAITIPQSNGSYSFTMPGKDVAISVSNIKYTITLVSHTGVTYSPSTTPVKVDYKGSYTVAVAVATGYEAVGGIKVKDNGETKGLDNGKYKLSDITGNHTISIDANSVKRITHKVTLTPATGIVYTNSSGGTIAGAQTVYYGDGFSFGVKLASDYEFIDPAKGFEVTATPGSITKTDIYKLSDIKEDWTVTVDASNIRRKENSGPVASTLTITLSESEGIILQPGAGTHSAIVGSSFTFYLTLADGYEGLTPQVTINEEIIQLTPTSTGWMYTIPSIADDVRVLCTFATTDNDNAIGSAIYSRDGQLYIDTPVNTTVVVYNFSGQMLLNRRVASGLSTFPLPAGNYIVRTDNGAVKLTIK